MYAFYFRRTCCPVKKIEKNEQNKLATTKNLSLNTPPPLPPLPLQFSYKKGGGGICTKESFLSTLPFPHLLFALPLNPRNFPPEKKGKP